MWLVEAEPLLPLMRWWIVSYICMATPSGVPMMLSPPAKSVDTRVEDKAESPGGVEDLSIGARPCTSPPPMSEPGLEVAAAGTRVSFSEAHTSFLPGVGNSPSPSCYFRH